MQSELSAAGNRTRSRLTAVQPENKVKTHFYTENKVKTHCHTLTVIQVLSQLPAAGNRTRSRLTVMLTQHMHGERKKKKYMKEVPELLQLAARSLARSSFIATHVQLSHQVKVHRGCGPAHQPHHTAEESSGASQRPSPLIKDQLIPKTSSAILLCTRNPSPKTTLLL